MVIDGCKSLIIRCHFCTRLKEYRVNLFQIKGEEKLTYRCDCGEENVVLSRDRKGIKVFINCFNCGSKHYYNLDLYNVLMGNNLIHCPFAQEVLFIGDSEKANNILLEKSLRVGQTSEEELSKEYLTNFDILARVLSYIYGLKKRGRIECKCGNSQIYVELFSDRVELECLSCHSIKIIFAETEEDLSVLEKKDNIILEEEKISCIDSMKENRDIKNKRRL